MTIVNNTATDAVFEIDVNSPLKGQVSRLVVPASSSATASAEEVLILVLDTNFQAAIAAGTVTLVYGAADVTWLAAVTAYLSRTL